MQKLMV